MTKREVLKLLKEAGWVEVKGGKGSHTKVKKDGKMIIVLGHNLSSELKRGTLSKILKAAELE